jgi:hypothetical protein
MVVSRQVIPWIEELHSILPLGVLNEVPIGIAGPPLSTEPVMP